MPLPIVIIPGYLENARAYRSLELQLQENGFPVLTVPLGRRDWLQTIVSGGVRLVLERLDETIEKILQQTHSQKVNLIGHSAGGWIGRIYLGQVPYSNRNNQLKFIGNGCDRVSSLVTLGTPHSSQERWTRASLDFVNTNYPGAFYPHVRYICIAGKSIFGQRFGSGWFAYSSYQQTCGNGATWGDGITPIASAHLEGAENLTIEGVLHSPRSPGIWYGSPEIFHQWMEYLSL